jgi:DNA-binding GntR family transcriptional regulator
MQEISPEDAIDLYSVREVLECMAARLAAKNINEDQLTKLKVNLEKQKSIIEKKDSLTYSKLDFEFHSLIYEASMNGCLIDLLNTLKHKMKPLVCNISPIMDELYENHTEAYNALEKKDAQRAEKVFIQHNELMKNQIIVQRT